MCRSVYKQTLSLFVSACVGLLSPLSIACYIAMAFHENIERVGARGHSFPTAIGRHTLLAKFSRELLSEVEFVDKHFQRRHVQNYHSTPFANYGEFFFEIEVEANNEQRKQKNVLTSLQEKAFLFLRENYPGLT